MVTTEKYVPEREGDNYVIVKHEGLDRNVYLVVGPGPVAQQWTAWYADMLAQKQTVAWPTAGLRVFKSAWRDAMLFTWNGLPVGTIGWNGAEWWWYNLEHWGHTYGTGAHVEVSPDERLKFHREQQAIALRPEHERVVLEAELRGRREAFRDESYSLVQLWGQARATRVGRAYDAAGVTFRCTGYYDQVLEHLDHDGDSCPVHESDPDV